MRRLYLVLAVVVVAAAAVVAYALSARPYIKGEATYMMTGPGVGMIMLTVVNPSLTTKCVTSVVVLSPPGLEAELHRTIVNGDVVSMMPVSEVCIPPLSTLQFTHLSYHIMLMGNATGPVEAELVFSDGTVLRFTAMPSSMGSMTSMG